MYRPSKRHRVSIVNELVQSALRHLESATDDRRTTFHGHTYKIDPDVFHWTLLELAARESQFTYFRGRFLESDFASALVANLAQRHTCLPANLAEEHARVQQSLAGHIGKSQIENWVGEVVYTDPLTGRALDDLAAFVAEGKIPARSIMSDCARSATRLATCEDHRDLVLRLDDVRLKAVHQIREQVESDGEREPAAFELTCNPFFKRSSERLSPIVERKYGFAGRLDYFLSASAYLKAFERLVGDIISACAVQRMADDAPPAVPLVQTPFDNSHVLTSVKADVEGLVYVLGSFDRRITIYNEQVRSLRLARALLEESIATPERKVAVVGGGVAGVTTAVALASKGCNVTLFERNSELVAVQNSASHRYVHPHIFSWPIQGSTRKDAGLPLLDWSADTADKVVEEFRTRLNSIEKNNNKLKVRTNTVVRQISVADGKVAVDYETGVRSRNEQYEILLLAIGFGSDEFNQGSFQSPSYWDQDQLSNCDGGRVLVSGTGDGGLIDVVRAAVADFDHAKFIEGLGRNADVVSLGQEIMRIDEKAKKLMVQNREFEIWEEFEEIEISDALLKLVEGITNRKVEVSLNHRRKEPFALGAATINKAFVLLLIRVGAVKLIRGAMKSIEKNGDEWKVGIDADEHTFDHVIVRHGPRVRDYFETVVGEDLSKACSQISGTIAELAITEKLDEATDSFFSPW